MQTAAEELFSGETTRIIDSYFVGDRLLVFAARGARESGPTRVEVIHRLRQCNGSVLYEPEHHCLRHALLDGEHGSLRTLVLSVQATDEHIRRVCVHVERESMSNLPRRHQVSLGLLFKRPMQKVWDSHELYLYLWSRQTRFRKRFEALSLDHRALSDASPDDQDETERLCAT